MTVPPGMRDMILWAAKKLTGTARIVENRVAIKPMAMVTRMVPETKVFTLLPGAAKPRLTSHLGAGIGFTLPKMSSKLSLSRIGPSVGLPANLSPTYVYMQLQAHILSTPPTEIVIMSGLIKLVATVRA